MPSLKAIKRRLSSVRSTQHIMKAMDLVAASKLQKAKERRDAVMSMFTETKRIMDEVQGTIESPDNIFLARRAVKSAAYVVITSDRGLCGGYNVNVAKKAYDHMTANKDIAEKIISVGSKGLDYFRRRKRNIAKKYPGMSDTLTYKNAEDIAALITKMYTEGEADEVYVVYTQFQSMTSHVPLVERILPVGAEKQASAPGGEISYDPDIDTFLTHAVPMYLGVFLYGAMAEAIVCEQAARMMSMDAATNNAEEIIDKLTLVFNRERQAIITQELTEIVGGANALN
jgi:F-type H+-transporting ATPase subunit gamma